ncbi:MAG: hypothetical protein V3S51_08600 [Dehalococcoidia bacterium]
MLKKASLSLMAVLLVSLLAGCNGIGGSVTPIELVPQRANLLVYLNLSQIVEDEDAIAGLSSELPIDAEDQQKLDDLIELMMGLEEAVLFFDTSESESSSYGALLVKGTFVENDLVTEIEASAEETFTISGYKDYKLYTDSTQESALAFLGSNGFVFGEMQAVKDVIQVKEGELSAVSGKVLDVYNDLGDDHIVKAAMLVSRGLISEGLGETSEDFDLPFDMSAFEDIETLGVTLDENEELTSILLQLCFTNTDSAKEAADLVNLVTMMIGVVDIEEAADALTAILDNLDVSRIDSCLDLSIELTEEHIGTLMQSIFMNSFMESNWSDVQLDIE